MENQKIKEILNNYLNKEYSDEFIKSLTGKKPGKFFNSLKELDILQVKKVLRNKPEFSNLEHEGWHALFYAALSNKSEIVDIIIKTAIQNGLTHFPQTTEFKKNTSKNTDIFSFCVQNDLDKSYSQYLLFLNNVSEHNFERDFRVSLWLHTPKVGNLIKQLWNTDLIQDYMLKFFNEDYENTNGSVLPRSFKLIKENLKFNPVRFKDFDINIKHTLPSQKNYFTSTLNGLIHCAYDLEEDKQGIEKIKSILNYFLNAGFSLDTLDNEGKNARHYLNKFLERTYDTQFKENIEDYLQCIEKQSLDNSLDSKKEVVERKKIKI